MADITITAASVLASSSANITDGTAGATITAGQVLYRDSTSGTMKLADSDASAATAAPVGIALHGASSGQPIKYVTADPAFTFGGTVAAGDTIWLSDTAGGMTLLGPHTTSAELETGDVITVLGVAVTTTTMNLKMVTGGTV